MSSLFDRLLEISGADHLCIFRVVQTSVGPAAVNILSAGASPSERAICFEGLPDFSRPPRRNRRTFFESIDGKHELRHLYYRGSELVGACSLYYETARPQSRNRSWSKVQAELDQLLAEREQSDRVYEKLCGKLLVDRRGKVELSTPEIAGQIPPEDIQRAIALSEQDRSRPIVLRGAEMKISPLYSPDRELLLIEVTAAPPASLAPDAQLTPMQREVAFQAAAGATAAEISRSIHSGVETVRTHLREIYRRLGVASRLELAQVLEGSQNYA